MNARELTEKIEAMFNEYKKTAETEKEELIIYIVAKKDYEKDHIECYAYATADSFALSLLGIQDAVFSQVPFVESILLSKLVERLKADIEIKEYVDRVTR